MNRLSMVAASLISTFALAGSAFAFSTPLPSRGQKSALTKQIKAGAAAELKQFGPSAKLKVTYGHDAKLPVGFIGNGLVTATATIYTKGSVLPGLKPSLIGQVQRQYSVIGNSTKADGDWNRLLQARAAGK
jgi:hypothetical protein